MELLKFYKKWVEPFIALGIFLMLLSIGFLLSKEHELKERISENCEWAEEDYRCYCKKGDVLQIESILNDDFDFSNVTIVK